MRGVSILVAGLLTVATAAQAPPALAAGGGLGSSNECLPVGPSVLVDGGNTTRVAGGDSLPCPAPVNAPGGSFGPHDTRDVDNPSRGGARPPPNTPCHFEYQSPVRLQFGAGYSGDITNPTGNPPPAWEDPGYQNLLALPGSNARPRIDTFFQNAGTADFYTPWMFDGTWDASGRCTNPTQLWTSPCRIAGAGTFPECLVPEPRIVVGQAAPVALLGENLAAFVNGRFTGGTISSLPEAPAHPGLTNLATCFYVAGMSVDGAPADPQQDTFWAKTVIGTEDVDEGRHIVYVFRIHVSYKQTTWDFGDGSPPLTIPRSGVGAPPGPCTNHSVPNQQFVTAHTYLRYSTGDGFHVTVSHRYGVDVDEFWWDSAGSHHLVIQDAVAPVDVPGAPEPFFAMPIVQEEGVPIGR